MIGICTVYADNPSLTVKYEKRREERRKAGKDANALRIVVDSKAKTPVGACNFKQRRRKTTNCGF